MPSSRRSRLTSALFSTTLLLILSISTPLLSQFNPTLVTGFDNLQGGISSGFTQEMLFPTASEGPYSLDVEFSKGSYNFTGFVPQQVVGSAVIDVFIQTPQVLISGQVIAEVQITSVAIETMEAIAMVVDVTGNVAPGLALLGFPNPTGQIAFDVVFTDFPGDTGADMSVTDSGILPLSGILDFDLPLVWDTEPIYFHSDSGGEVVVTSTLVSSSGLVVSFEETFAIADPLGAPFQRGDCNGDGSFNIADGIFTLDSLFSGGPTGDCSDACDANDDGSINIADAVYSLAALFSGGSMPMPPSPGSCGVDPTITDPLDCQIYNDC